MSFLRSIPDASLIDIFLAVPKFARPLHEFAQQLMRGPSPFTEGEREVMAAYVSSLNRCAFCEASHTEAAARYGHDRKLIQELALNLAEADVTDRLKPIFRYVRKLTLLPAQVDQADVTANLEQSAAPLAGEEPTVIDPRVLDRRVPNTRSTYFAYTPGFQLDLGALVKSSFTEATSMYFMAQIPLARDSNNNLAQGTSFIFGFTRSFQLVKHRT
ncbi:hypothetical protein NITMOv2_4257 [Nitrospira moscoviensis]|uniref:Carboxymuconolactone decarboxylase-like domain-containing protein n=2 Tax=Nitrospira moscoviensis TaxID=42253 RepID=A0A0K2GI64_NITMO|nr:hypothetical protein NITMOv2_4257 [Nitrospira moscoviensis]